MRPCSCRNSTPLPTIDAVTRIELLPEDLERAKRIVAAEQGIQIVGGL